MEEKRDVLDTQIKGVTVKVAWQFFAGWTMIMVTLLFSYSSLKTTISDQKFDQDKTNAIQDVKIENINTNGQLRDLQIKDLNERLNELSAQQKQQQENK